MTIFLFEGGQFKPYEWPEWDEVEDDADFLKSQGFSFSIPVGNTNGIHFEVWSTESKEQWIVEFSIPDRGYYILCHALPDLIELLSKLSTIAIAGALENGKFGTAFFRTANVREDKETG